MHTTKITKPGDYVFRLDQTDQELFINSALKAQKKQILNLNILIHHLAPNTKSKIVLKSVALDSAQINIKAKIKIGRNCPGVQADLEERVLLVSKNAKATVIPDLEILTDNVKCSHAASVTKIPERQIFYLKSRGLSQKQAERLVIKSFLGS